MLPSPLQVLIRWWPRGAVGNASLYRGATAGKLIACVAVLLGLGLTGCVTRANRAAGPGGSGVDDVRWINHGVPSLSSASPKRAVVVSFVTEFVTQKLVTDKTARPARFGDEHPGLSLEMYLYNDELLERLPDYLYGLLVQQLKLSGLEVVDADTTWAAGAYGRMRHAAPPPSATAPARGPAVGSDVGRVVRVDARPAAGLARVGDTASDQYETAERALLAELDAGVLIRAHFRLGVHKGRATIERGSSIHIRAPGYTGTLVAEDSVVSREDCRNHNASASYGPSVVAIDTDLYGAEVQRMFLRMTGSALQAANRPAGPAAGAAAGGGRPVDANRDGSATDAATH